ncbi:MAG: sigma 54-interacting transcriptional regulator [Desulfobacteraceae bacterium]|jgi:two-component system response regulator HydG|nr:sigma 54-interacting transcriptional regulator [Desulfobacterales bacterium]MBL6968220.1 sigma 54-interacting transcriptional regulator [Desulfobacteraceae bacterium]MBL7101172.1 sigma 54-interacting transcriptional regulator [Desulfobacteraceae bacterium]MBL7171734.1 sigma 54-interacting transcriptional regulator [Desulfobacteraceae bacterium]
MEAPVPIGYYKEIFETIADALMVVGPDGTILVVNGAMERLSGYAREELMGASCTILDCDACELILSETKEKWCVLFETGLVKGKRCLMTKKDGSYASVIQDASLLKDEFGELVGALGVFKDASEIDKKDQKIQELSSVRDVPSGFYGMVGKSRSMERIYQLVEKVAESDAPVVIYGESGTGKELVAHALHELGRRQNGPFVQFNCAALNESLLESELFGHTKGAFTGAYRHRMGRFEAAQEGDIFLDEIGEMPLGSQVKLLRVLETKQFERVGDHRSIRVDVRVITATNRDLSHMVSQGAFRQDLFFRINVLPIHLPPLREKVEDIPLLVDAFVRKLNRKTGKALKGVSPDVMKAFLTYGWPGNIRELKSALQYAFVVTESGLIQKEDLPSSFFGGDENRTFEMTPPPVKGDLAELEEKTALLKALRLSQGNRTEAARLLGVHRMTVWNRMKKYGIHITSRLDE